MLKFIGIGSAFNTAEGNNSAYYKKDGNLFLIDCGSANFGTMKESGFLDDVENIYVYVTHTHADHVGSLADLIFYMYYAKGEFKKRVKVYAMSNINVDDYLEMNGITEQHYDYAPLAYSSVIEIEKLGLGFVVYKTEHVDELDSYGIIIDFYMEGEFVIYTGDTNKLPNNINKMLGEEVDCLFVDTCSQDYDGNVHLSLKKLNEGINQEHKAKVWCMHLDENFDKELAKSLGFNIAEVEV